MKKRIHFGPVSLFPAHTVYCLHMWGRMRRERETGSRSIGGSDIFRSLFFPLVSPPPWARPVGDVTRKGRWSASHDLPSVVEHRPPLSGRGLSHSSLSQRGVPPIHQGCQQWHPFPLCARRLGTSGAACIPDTRREQHTDTLMDLFIRPFITQGANGESQCTVSQQCTALPLPSWRSVQRRE